MSVAAGTDPCSRLLTGRRIAVVSLYFDPDQTGIAPYATHLCRALRNAGCELTVITGVPHYPQWKVASAYRRGLVWNESLDGNIEVIRVRHVVPKRATVRQRGLMDSTFMALVASKLITRRFDGIIAITPSLGGLAGALLASKGTPVSAIVQDLVGLGAEETGTAPRSVARQLVRVELAALRRCALVGSIGATFRRILVENGVNPERIVDTPNFTHIDSVRCTKEEARARLGWPQEAFIAVHTGNIGAKQDLETAIGAARILATRMPNFQLVIVGDGNAKSSVQSFASGCRNVNFVPPLPGQEYPFALHAADVLLLLEKDGIREMSLPSKLTSYVSVNRPIVAAITDGGATFAELTTHRFGHIARPSQPEDLARLIASIQHDPSATRTRLAAQASYARRLDSRSAAARYVAFALGTVRTRDQKDLSG